MTNFKHHFIYKLVGLCFLMLIMFVSTTYVGNVKADIAPPEPPSGTTLMPMRESTNVRMISETVLIEIDEASAASNGFSKVEATFTMRNLGDEEEQMDVRFPLDQRFWPQSGIKCNEDNPFLIGITDLKAFVNGKAVRTEQTNETVYVWAEEEPLPISVPCWAEFPVTFPVGEDVIVKVTYSSEPYRHALAQYEYSYVLVTGEGWKGTIGSADIIFQTPYELYETNFISCEPDCEMAINEVRWHYEDFEPDFNIKVSLLPPPAWQKILIERANIVRNSDDGNAWGRLARAYVEAIKESKAFRSDEIGKELLNFGKNAYRKAVSLLPDDVDWQYEYADLLCEEAYWDSIWADSIADTYRECVEQMQRVYMIDPEHEELNEMFQLFRDGYEEEVRAMIDFSGPSPDFLVLTPQPTETTTPTEKPTQVVATATVTASPTSEITKTATATTMVDEVTETPVPEKKREESNSLIYFGGAMLLFVAVFVFIKFKKS